MVRFGRFRFGLAVEASYGWVRLAVSGNGKAVESGSGGASRGPVWPGPVRQSRHVVLRLGRSRRVPVRQSRKARCV